MQPGGIGFRMPEMHVKVFHMCRMCALSVCQFAMMLSTETFTLFTYEIS